MQDPADETPTGDVDVRPDSGAQWKRRIFGGVGILLALLLLFRRWLPVGERAVIYAALAIGVTVTGSGLMHRFLPGLVTGHYGGFASTKGKYYPYLVQFPEWMVPGEPNSQAAVSAFEGDALVPWDA